MPSFQDLLGTALSRRKVPAFLAGSIHDLGLKLGLSSPISMRGILDALDELPFASRTIETGPKTAGYVHGWSTLFLQADGATAFSGHMHESGVAGDNFLVAIALLDVKDSSGRTVVFANDDWLAGQLDFGPSDRDWITIGMNQLIADNFEAVRTSRVQTLLHVSTNAWQVTELVLTSIFVAAGIVLAAVFGAQTAKKCSENRTLKCGWVAPGTERTGPLTPGDPGSPPPGAQVDYYCT